MRLRSTGLGKTELVGKIDDVTQVDDYLILHVGTTEPVKWHVRAALDRSDIFKMIGRLLKPSNLLFLIAHLFYDHKSETPPEF